MITRPGGIIRDNPVAEKLLITALERCLVIGNIGDTADLSDGCCTFVFSLLDFVFSATGDKSRLTSGIG